ncbi:pyrroline-5-carboxylate reductase dimerization domain-containing protein [Staphylococcus succinus]|uniref:pyrroline-5-carboxylate reductase dimerization domain-containing protein n=1 Tax=Staphylococcus succinus TaxID=61015 RepID=UPI003F5C681C
MVKGFYKSKHLNMNEFYIKSGKHPGTLKDKVTSPGGTTTKAIHTLEKYDFSYILAEAINPI